MHIKPIYSLPLATDVSQCVLLVITEEVSFNSTVIGLLRFPKPQFNSWTANVHMALVSASEQVTLVWFVVVGQWPQFDARML